MLLPVEMSKFIIFIKAARTHTYAWSQCGIPNWKSNRVWTVRRKDLHTRDAQGPIERPIPVGFVADAHISVSKIAATRPIAPTCDCFHLPLWSTTSSHAHTSYDEGNFLCIQR